MRGEVAEEPSRLSRWEVERCVAEVVRHLEARGEPEIASRVIGEAVMEALRGVDDVAFVRYASVYRNFQEAKDFEAFLSDMDARR